MASGKPGAVQVLRRLEFHYVPKHARLNMLESEIGVLVSQCLDRQFTAPPPGTVRRSIANLDSTKLPAISIPVALPNQTAGRLFDVDRLRRIINRRRRRSWPCCQSAAEQRPADKSAHYAGGDLTVLGACRHRQQKRTREQCNCHDS
jgi:hypothetical protein